MLENHRVWPSATYEIYMSTLVSTWGCEERTTHFHVSINPGVYTAPQLKYFMSGTSGVCSLNSRIAAGVRQLNAEPSPPPFGSMSRSERNDGKRSGPTVLRKTSAKEDPRCGLDIVVTERTRKVWVCKFVARYRQSRPPYVPKSAAINCWHWSAHHAMT